MSDFIRNTAWTIVALVLFYFSFWFALVIMPVHFIWWMIPTLVISTSCAIGSIVRTCLGWAFQDWSDVS